MRNLLIYSISLIIIFGCGKANKKPTKISITKEFLMGEWRMDSLVGKKNCRYDRIYFTDDNKYWRFTRNNKSYLVEGDWEWHLDTIFVAGIVEYLIEAVDSNHILMRNPSYEYYCTRRDSFDREDIDRFLREDKLKRLINGTWTLDSADAFPIEIPSWCDNLGRSTKFIFKEDGILKLIPPDTVKNKYCNNYSYDLSYWSDAELNLQETDMIINYQIVEFTDTILKLNGRFSQYGQSSIIKLRRNR